MKQHPFYKTHRWHCVRRAALRRDGYRCRECTRYGRTTPATTVHHILPLAWCLAHLAQLAHALTNLISLCDACHNKMHNRMTDALTPHGLALVDRRYKGNTPEGWPDQSG